MARIKENDALGLPKWLSKCLVNCKELSDKCVLDCVVSAEKCAGSNAPENCPQHSEKQTTARNDASREHTD